MERSVFITKFSERLNTLLQKEGYASNRSKAGVEITQLAKVAGVSYQMARKYVLGMALPDYYVVPKIAAWLKVSPGWLLFDEYEVAETELKSNPQIVIDVELLKYILNKCIVFFPSINHPEKIINFIVSIIYDASHINTDPKTILKIIDMMLSSAIQLSEIHIQRSA